MKKLLIVTLCCLVSMGSIGCSRNLDSSNTEAAPKSVLRVYTTPSLATPSKPHSSATFSNVDFLTAPDNWWIVPVKIPLYVEYKWPELTKRQEHVRDQRFRFEEICGSRRASKNAFNVVDKEISVRARIQNGTGDWSAQEQIYHLPGDTWKTTQLTGSLLNALVGELRDCGKTQTGARVLSLAQVGAGEVAILSVPAENGSVLTLHEYLTAPGSTGSLVELSLWVEGEPKYPWSGLTDLEIMDALEAGLCRKVYC